MPLNLDFHSGNPIGLGILPSTYYKGHRTTSESVTSALAVQNLHIWTDAKATKIIFEGKRAVGILLQDGRKG